MPDGGALALAGTIAEFLGAALPVWNDRKAGAARRREQDRFIAAVAERLANHHLHVARWCEESHLPTSLLNLPTGAPTIGLHLRSIPRRLGGGGGQRLDETDLLVDGGDFALLGDPGAGKTTTMRRLARAVAVEPAFDDADWYRFVVLVVCRENDFGRGLYPVLADITGITGTVASLVDDPQLEIRRTLANGALILVDGLDEVRPNERGRIETELVQLAREMTTSKLVVSCRSGAYAENLGARFTPVEILPLSDDQIREAVSAWLSPEDAERFHETIEAQGGAAKELADRPLFLAHMVTAFKRQGTVPERSVDLCRTIVRLVLQDWDESRGVQRPSAYARFGVEEKMDLLSELAYRLLDNGRIRFDDEDLNEIMREIGPAFDLPSGETRAIAREIESHTGLVVQVGRSYEFSHLSLQEFLAGSCLARRPSASLLRQVWDRPDLAAVAIALSSDASESLATIARSFNLAPADLGPLHQFLKRVVLERPRLVASTALGCAVLRLTTVSKTFEPELYVELAGIKTVRQSVRAALQDLQETPRGRLVYFVGPDPEWPDIEVRYTAPRDFVNRVLGR